MQIPRLHPDTIEEVKQRADIVDVLSEHVVLRRRGKDFVGLCPFHEEKSPSFTVSPNKQMYYCFGCQAGGNVVKFLMERGKRSFSEVVLDLARRYQVSVQTLEPEQRQEFQRQFSVREQLYEILAMAAQFYVHALRQSPEQQALEYLRSHRQLSEETIQQFQLGYAPASWDTLYGYLVEQKRYPVQTVEQAGLIVARKSGGGYYDRFRDRLIIPIHDIQGRVIGFGGRSLGDEQPKYLNSPETDLFDKGKTLFALDKARATITKQDQAVVVEGYFDAIALHAVGITNAVASLGTALSSDQVRILLRYTESKQIVLNFDADAAGTKASERAIGEIADLAYRGQLQLRILNLPDGKDADEFLRKGNSKEYRELLKTAPLWLDWQIQQLLLGKDLKQADKFQQVTEQMVNLLIKINPAVDDDRTRAHYLGKCAELLCQGNTRLVQLRAESLLAQVKIQQRRGNKYRLQKQAVPPSASELLECAEALLLRIYLHCPEHRQAIINTLEERDLLFSLPHHRFLWLKILDVQTHHDMSSADLISNLQDLCIDFPENIARVSPLFHLDEKRERDILLAPKLIESAVACIERVMYENITRHFLELWEKTDPSTEPEKLRYYSQEFYKAKQRIKELDQDLQFLYFYR